MSGASFTHVDAHRQHRRVDLSRPSDRRAAVALVVAALLALLIWSPSIGGRQPGDPAAVAGDARLGRCGGTIDDVEYAFTIERTREYQRYLPALGRATELELDRPALVVVYRGEFPGGGSPSSPTPTAGSTVRNVCIYVGVAGQGELNYYSDVSIAGLRVAPNGPVIVPAPRT